MFPSHDRARSGNYFPKSRKFIIGTYTHDELQLALQHGYEIVNIEWSIVWEETQNPYKIITNKLYELRNKSKDDFDYWFYKQMQNHSYGKLAQRRANSEILMDSVGIIGA